MFSIDLLLTTMNYIVLQDNILVYCLLKMIRCPKEKKRYGNEQLNNCAFAINEAYCM